MRTAGGILDLLVATGCTVGVALQDFKPARGPAGEPVAVGSDGVVLLLRQPLERRLRDGPGQGDVYDPRNDAAGTEDKP